MSNPTTDVEHNMNVWGHSGAGYAGLTGQNNQSRRGPRPLAWAKEGRPFGPEHVKVELNVEFNFQPGAHPETHDRFQAHVRLRTVLGYRL